MMKPHEFRRIVVSDTSIVSEVTEYVMVGARPWKEEQRRQLPSAFRKNLNKRQLKRPKRVTFYEDDVGDIVAEIDNPNPIYRDEMGKHWWTREELDQILTITQKKALHHQSKHPEFAETVAELLFACSQSNANEIALRTNSAVRTIVSAAVRGLEIAVTPQLSHRRRHVSQTLYHNQLIASLTNIFQSIQALLRSQKKLNNRPWEERSSILANQYERNTKYACLMARVLADGDALEVLETTSLSMFKSCNTPADPIM